MQRINKLSQSVSQETIFESVCFSPRGLFVCQARLAYSSQYKFNRVERVEYYPSELLHIKGKKMGKGLCFGLVAGHHLTIKELSFSKLFIVVL